MRHELIERSEVGEEVIDALSASDRQDAAALRTEGQFAAWTDPATSDRRAGYSDWVAYIPSAGRAVHVSNGNPEWYDAGSLAGAVLAARVPEGVEIDSVVLIGESEVHVTRIDDGCGVHGHETSHCDPAGCAGDELFFGPASGAQPVE